MLTPTHHSTHTHKKKQNYTSQCEMKTSLVDRQTLNLPVTAEARFVGELLVPAPPCCARTRFLNFAVHLFFFCVDQQNILEFY